MEDIKKLPKWAQTKIQVLERDAEDWKKQAQQIAGDAETNTYIDGRINYPDTPLPNDSVIRFKLKTGDFKVRIKKDCLEIMSSMTREGDMCIVPSVSNVVYIKFK